MALDDTGSTRCLPRPTLTARSRAAQRGIDEIGALGARHALSALARQLIDARAEQCGDPEVVLDAPLGRADPSDALVDDRAMRLQRAGRQSLMKCRDSDGIEREATRARELLEPREMRGFERDRGLQRPPATVEAANVCLR
jgi:hypothetical protein